MLAHGCCGGYGAGARRPAGSDGGGGACRVGGWGRAALPRTSPGVPGGSPGGGAGGGALRRRSCRGLGAESAVGGCEGRWGATAAGNGAGWRLVRVWTAAGRKRRNFLASCADAELAALTRACPLPPLLRDARVHPGLCSAGDHSLTAAEAGLAGRRPPRFRAFKPQPADRSVSTTCGDQIRPIDRPSNGHSPAAAGGRHRCRPGAVGCRAPAASRGCGGRGGLLCQPR